MQQLLVDQKVDGNKLGRVWGYSCTLCLCLWQRRCTAAVFAAIAAAASCVLQDHFDYLFFAHPGWSMVMPAAAAGLLQNGTASSPHCWRLATG